MSSLYFIINEIFEVNFDTIKVTRARQHKTETVQVRKGIMKLL